MDTKGAHPARQSLFKNIRVYWLAFIAFWGIVLFGYDTGVGGGVVNHPFFAKYFGLVNPDGKKNTKRTNAVLSNVVSVLQAGAFFGALSSAPVSAKLGRKYTLLGFTAVFMVGAILTTVAKDPHNGLQYIYAGRVIAGFGIGGISAVAPTYVSECSPKEVRGRITGCFQIAAVTGVMISYFLNYGVGIHLKEGINIWRIPFGFQLVPAGIMVFGLLTVKESPRWLASVGRTNEAIRNLAYLRKESMTSPAVLAEMAEIEAAIKEEKESRANLGLKQAFLGKGNSIRFVIAFIIFFLQQWTGQNSVNYYAPQIFESIGYTGVKTSLLASGVYGVMKVATTIVFVAFGVETLGRKKSFLISGLGMGIMFFTLAALLKTHPPPVVPVGQEAPAPPAASKAMAATLYIYVVFYSMGWGPLPWIYVSDIFPTQTRHFGLATASASQWLWNFVISKITPDLVTALGYQLFLVYASINVVVMTTFAILIPETKGRSLEEMDIIFGAVSAERRQADIHEQERIQRQQDATHTGSVDNDRNSDEKV